MRSVEISRSRGSGPGGQHRNRVETRVTLLHLPTGISGTAGERRTVRENRPVAVRRLRLELAVRVRSGVPLGEIGSVVWRARRGQGKQSGRIVVSEAHWDYPALLAEALDVIVAGGLDVRRASLRLEVSQSQLVKLVGRHAPAMAALNTARKHHGMGAFRT
ncbi:MAG: peptide chain release factor-like protein [Planctomycetota bacterium]